MANTTRSTSGGELRDMIARLRARKRNIEGTIALLQMLESTWFSAEPAARERMQKLPGWANCQDEVRRMVDWL